MNTTRSGEQVSAQIGKMGVIDNLQVTDFTLPDGQCFNVKNDGTEAVLLEVRLSGMSEDETIETKFETGWNPEIVKAVKQTDLTDLQLRWGY
jgi:hypothetical protein